MSDDDLPPWRTEPRKMEIQFCNPSEKESGIIIVNKKTHVPTKNDYYCGRGSPLGNPFDFCGSNHPQVIRHVASREEAISCYENYLKEKIKEKDPEVRAALNQICKMLKNGPVYLVCYCCPEDCHARVIKRIIEEKLNAPKNQ